ncbi:ABC transporter ATP-binding protein [candidate division KSB1 bacterium]
MNILEVENISKSFGKFTAVHDVSFSLNQGTVFGLLGPNGAGKTTTIRMIMNIIIPDSGRISVLGDSDLNSATDSIGYLPEERGLYRKMKIRELLLFLTELKSMNRKEAGRGIDMWLERLELKEWKNKKVEELSRGMQQKLMFIATIVHNPKLLILDEPFSGLDPINTNIVKNILVELKNNGTTIILSTHMMESAERLSEEIFLIDKGRCVLSGKLNDIKKNIGKENVLIEYEGKDDFLKRSDQISKYDIYNNYAEVQLVENADSQKLLREAMESVIVRKFELKEPSLNDIFIESVNKSKSGAN